MKQGAEGVARAEQVMEALQADSKLGANLRAPSVSYGTINLYMRGVLEEATAGNLPKPISELVDGDGSLIQARYRPARLLHLTKMGSRALSDAPSTPLELC